MIKYEISKNEYQSKWVVFAITDFNIKGVFNAATRKECANWLKGRKSK